MLYVFDIRKPIGPDGQPIEPDLVLANSTATRYVPFVQLFHLLSIYPSSFPKPFVCDFIPRSPQHVEILNDTYESVLPSATTKPVPNKV